MAEREVPLVGALTLPRSLSPTSAGAWQQCELKYALTYLFGWQEAGTLPQLVGNTAHRAIELLYGLPSPERTRDAASELLVRAVAEESGQDGFESLRTLQPDLDRVLVEAGEDALDGLFWLEDPTTITVGPEGLEVWVSADLYGAPIRGRIDRLYDASGAYVVADYKSGKVPKSAFTRKAFFGLWTYAAALAASDPDRVLPDRIELLYLTGRERLSRPVLRGVALEHAKNLARIWAHIWQAVGRGSVTARTGPLCGWCAFEPACPARVKTDLPAVGTAEHDELLAATGLQRRDRAVVATALERAETPAAGADPEVPA